MDTTVLQQFLDEGMLDIGDDDSRFDALAKASEALFEKLTNDLEALAQYTLVALDADIPPDEPALQEAEELVKKYNWRTIRNRSADRLRQILRAVILNTLANFTEQYPKQVAIVWLMGSSYLLFMRSNHGEKSVGNNVITKMGEFAEKTLAVNLGNISNMDAIEDKLPKLELNKLDFPQINQEELKLFLEAASGPRRQNGQAFPNNLRPNSNWPYYENWSYEFAPIAANGIASVINEANRALQNILAKYFEDLQLELNSYLEQVNSNLGQIYLDVQTFKASPTKTNLLWWKESLYSPKLKQSYRTLTSSAAMLALAFDLSQQVSPFYPVSVDFFLRETAQELLNNADENNKFGTISFINLLKQLESGTNRQVIAQLLSAEKAKSGRISLVSYLRSLILSKHEAIENLTQRVGVSGDQEISLTDFAVWCFRTFQAEQLIASKVA